MDSRIGSMKNFNFYESGTLLSGHFFYAVWDSGVNMAKYFSPQGAGRNISPCHLGKKYEKGSDKREKFERKRKKRQNIKGK